jgi:hypothetical protein
VHSRAPTDASGNAAQFGTLAQAAQVTQPRPRRALNLETIPTFQIWQQQQQQQEQRQHEKQAPSHPEQQRRTDWRELLDKAKQAQLQQQAGPSMLTDTFRWVSHAETSAPFPCLMGPVFGPQWKPRFQALVIAYCLSTSCLQPGAHIPAHIPDGALQPAVSVLHAS